MQEYTIAVEPKDALKRLDLFLLEFANQNNLGLSRASIQKLIKDGSVTLNGKISKPNYKTKPKDFCHIRIADKDISGLLAEDIPLDIIHEDDDIMIINKPRGVVVHPAPGNKEHTLVNALLHHTKYLSDINNQRPGIVHRLDKDTSGVMVIAKNNAAYLSLVKQFAGHEVKKIYVACVKGKMEFDEGVIDLPLGRHKTDRKKMAVGFNSASKEAKTHYRTLKRFSEYSLLELVPFTGRTHQLRVHLAHLGHPILGDNKYGKAVNYERMYLHAKSIGFMHPTKNKFVEYSTDIPRDFLKPEQKP